MEQLLTKSSGMRPGFEYRQRLDILWAIFRDQYLCGQVLGIISIKCALIHTKTRKTQRNAPIIERDGDMGHQEHILVYDDFQSKYMERARRELIICGERVIFCVITRASSMCTSILALPRSVAGFVDCGPGVHI